MKLIIQAGENGRGVFTAERIASGERIIRFTGPFLHKEQTTPQTYAVQIGPDLYLGASGSFDDYINHSCEPNAGLRIEGTETDLVAIRDIGAGEEISFDYSTTMDEDDWEMACHCGRPTCRKTIRDGKHLPRDIWRRYVALGIVPEYVRKSREGWRP